MWGISPGFRFRVDRVKGGDEPEPPQDADQRLHHRRDRRAVEGLGRAQAAPHGSCGLVAGRGGTRAPGEAVVAYQSVEQHEGRQALARAQAGMDAEVTGGFIDLAATRHGSAACLANQL